MSKIQSSVTFAMKIEAPLEIVRAAIADPSWSKWVPFLKSDRCEGDSAGSQRTCTLSHPDPQMDGYQLQETIVENDKAAGRFAYAIENPPMPVENLKGCIETTQIEGGTVIASWTAQFEAAPEILAEVRAMTIQMYQMGLQGLETYARSQAI